MVNCVTTDFIGFSYVTDKQNFKYATKPVD